MTVDPRASGADILPPVTRAERHTIAFLTVAFVAVCGLWAVLTPIYAVPDEHAHLNSSIRLTQGLTWPAPGDARLKPEVAGARAEGEIPAEDRSSFDELESDERGVDQMTQHPPLYYGFGATVLTIVDYEQRRADQALLALRLAGLIFVVPLPLLVWNSTRRLTRSPRAAIVAAAALFAVPQLAQVLGGVTNDGMTILWCSIVAWLTIRWMTGDRRLRVLVALGVVLGLALLTKGTALPFIPFTALVLLIWPRDAGLSRRCIQAFGALALAFVVGGWWWLRNIIVHGDLQPSGLAGTRETRPWEPGTGPDFVQYLDLLWSNMTVRFWGEFGLLDYPLPEVLTDILSVVSVVVIAGYAYTRHPRRLQTIVLSLLPLLLVLMLVANTWRHFVRTQLPAGMQGRYLFVALVALIAVSAVAWMRCIPAQHHRRAGLIALVVAGFMAVLGPFRLYIGAYENSLYRVTGAGLRDLLAATPAGTFGFAVALVVVATTGLTAVLLAARFIAAGALVLEDGGGGGAHRSAGDGS